MGIRGIGGVFFKSRDPEALADWYERHLGVRRDAEGYTVFGWREIDRPHRVGETVWSPFPEDTAYFAPSSSPWMINYRVDDLDRELERLRDEGVEVVGEPESFDYGRFAWVLDCDGNKVELWEPPEAPAFDVTVPSSEGEADAAGVWLCEPGSSMATDAASMRPDMIEKEVVVPLTRDVVWTLWTTKEGICSWLVDDARVELRVGGPYELLFNPEAPPSLQGSEGCRVLSFIPERMLSFTWNAPPQFDATRPRHTHVVIELFEEKDTTRVSLTHLGWPDEAVDPDPLWKATFLYFEAAWQRVLDTLATRARELQR